MDYDIGSKKSVESDLVDWVEIVRGHLTEVDDFYKQCQAHTYQTSKFKYICRIKDKCWLDTQYRLCSCVDFIDRKVCSHFIALCTSTDLLLHEDEKEFVTVRTRGRPKKNNCALAKD